MNFCIAIAKESDAAMKREVDSLTSLRGIAAIYVVLYHSYPNRGVLINHGYLAVDLFFMLSGFVMCTAYSKSFIVRLDIMNYSRFIIRRLGRVYPLYLLCTIVSAVLLTLMHMSIGDGLPLQASLAFNIVMVQAWGFSGSVDYPTWSLSAEWFAYLSFPLLTVLLLRQKGSHAKSIALLCVSASTLICLSYSGNPNGLHRSGPLDIAWDFSFLPVLRCLAEFIIGMMCFILCRDFSGCKKLGETPIAASLLLSLLLLLSLPNFDLLVLMVFAVLIISLASGSGMVHVMLEWRPLIALGELSYSIYLLHPIALYIGNVEIQGFLRSYIERSHIHALSYLTMMPVKMQIYPILLATSYIVHRYYELPLRNVTRYLVPKSYEPDASPEMAPV